MPSKMTARKECFTENHDERFPTKELQIEITLCVICRAMWDKAVNVTLSLKAKKVRGKLLKMEMAVWCCRLLVWFIFHIDSIMIKNVYENILKIKMLSCVEKNMPFYPGINMIIIKVFKQSCQKSKFEHKGMILCHSFFGPDPRLIFFFFLNSINIKWRFLWTGQQN